MASRCLVSYLTEEYVKNRIRIVCNLGVINVIRGAWFTFNIGEHFYTKASILQLLDYTFSQLLADVVALRSKLVIDNFCIDFAQPSIHAVDDASGYRWHKKTRRIFKT